MSDTHRERALSWSPRVSPAEAALVATSADEQAVSTLWHATTAATWRRGADGESCRLAGSTEAEITTAATSTAVKDVGGDRGEDGFPGTDGSAKPKAATGLPDTEGSAVAVIPLHQRKRMRREIILMGIRRFPQPMAAFMTAKFKHMARARGLTADFLIGQGGGRGGLHGQ